MQDAAYLTGIRALSLSLMVSLFASAIFQKSVTAGPSTESSITPATMPAPFTANEMLIASIAATRLPDNYAYHMEETEHATESPRWQKITKSSNIFNVYCSPSCTDVAGTEYAEIKGKNCPINELRAIWAGANLIQRSQSGGNVGNISIMFLEHVPRYPGWEFEDGPLDGRLAKDSKTAMEFLLEAGTAVVEGAEKIEGNDCVIVATNTPYGLITVWLDPKQNYRLRKATEKKGPANFLAPAVTLEGDGMGIIEADYVIDNIVIKKMGEYSVPVSGNSSLLWIYKDGSRESWLGNIVRTRFQIDPDFSAMGVFVMDGIPEGTRVNHVLSGGKMDPRPYIWQDGKAVPGEWHDMGEPN